MKLVIQIKFNKIQYYKGLLEKEISIVANSEVMAAYNVIDTTDIMDTSVVVPENVNDVVNTSDIVCAETSDISTTSFNNSLNESGEVSLALSREFR